MNCPVSVLFQKRCTTLQGNFQGYPGYRCDFSLPKFSYGMFYMIAGTNFHGHFTAGRSCNEAETITHRFFPEPIWSSCSSCSYLISKSPATEQSEVKTTPRGTGRQYVLAPHPTSLIWIESRLESTQHFCVSTIRSIAAS